MDKYGKLVFLLITFVLFGATIQVAYSETSEEFYMLSLINKERQAQGLPTLSMNSALSSAAKSHSQDMINRSYFNHINPDGLTPSDRARNSGYNFIALGENICGNPSIDAGHTSLMNSIAHRNNILNPSFKEVGIGIVDGGPYGKMITQLFGTQVGGTTPSSEIPQEAEGKPDILIESIDVSGKAEVGNQITMKITLTNKGKKNAGNFVFAVFDGNPDNGKLLGKSSINSLYVGYKVTATLIWTPQTSGEYTIYFVSDYGNAVIEENEGNNISTYNLSISGPSQGTSSGNTVNNPSVQEQRESYKPDLSISSNDLSYQSTIYVNSSSNVYFRIKNIGQSAAYNIPINVYLNGNLKSSSTIPQILPSSFNDFNVFLTFTSPGEYLIEAKVDPENTLQEISEMNNIVTLRFKVIERNTNSINTTKTVNSPKDIDLLIYPYYIMPEELVNGDLFIRAKIKNKGNSIVEEANVSFYERDMNSSDRLIEKISITLGPDEIIEKEITFSPFSREGEIIVVIDEENKIKESDEGNNIATKIFSVKALDMNASYIDDQIVNTTPEEANISEYIRVTMKVTDMNASNSYIYYTQDANRSFTISKMNNEGNGSYFIDIDGLGNDYLEYYFEVDDGYTMIKYPEDAPNSTYITRLHYPNRNERKEQSNIIDNIKRIFSDIF